MAGEKGVTKRVYRVFWAWQDREEERWLERMALAGWSLVSVRGIAYTFRRSDPQKVIYRIDYQDVTDTDAEEYRQICEDSGWEWVDRSLNWLYLRRPYEPGVPLDLYTDNASRLKRYQSQLRTMAIAAAPVFLLAVVLSLPPLSLGEGWWVRGFKVFLAVNLVVLLYAMSRVWQVIRKIESRPEE